MKIEAGADKRLTFKFLVLVPHNDTRSLLRKQSDLLIKEGLTNVYPFPWAAPIAELSEYFSADELKFTARSLREFTGKEKFSFAEAGAITFPSEEEKMLLFGNQLKLNIPDSAYGEGRKKIKSIFSSLAVGSWLIPEANEQQLRAMSQKYDALPREKLSFRTSAIANMYWKPFQTGDGIGFKWKIGKLSWLPNKPLTRTL